MGAAHFRNEIMNSSSDPTGENEILWVHACVRNIRASSDVLLLLTFQGPVMRSPREGTGSQTWKTVRKFVQIYGHFRPEIMPVTPDPDWVSL